jgi:hypothetical protein
MSPMKGVTADKRKNKMAMVQLFLNYARVQLLQAVSEDILMQVSMKLTTNEVWVSLKTVSRLRSCQGSSPLNPQG